MSHPTPGALRHVDPSTPTGELASILHADGAVVIDGLAPDALLDRLDAELAPWIARTPRGGDEFTGTSTRRTGALVARCPAARELVMHPTILGAVEATLAAPTAPTTPTTVQLHLTQSIAIGPGETAQALHRDQWAWSFFPFPVGTEVQVNTLWALTEFTEANGATRVVPGSHRWDDRLRLPHEASVPAEMGRGSVLLYTGSVYHGGGANVTEDRTRVAINIDYCAGWLRQEENQYLSCPPEVARTLPIDLLRLMGYRHGAYALGYVDDARDPLDALLGPSCLELGEDERGDAGQSFGRRAALPS